MELVGKATKMTVAWTRMVSEKRRLQAKLLADQLGRG